MTGVPSFLKAPEPHRVPPDTIDDTKTKVGKFTEYPLCEILASRDFTTPTDIAALRIEGGTYLAKACMNFSQRTFSRRIVFPLFDPGERYAQNVSELEADFPSQYECTRALVDATYRGTVDYLIASNIVTPEDTHSLLLFNRFAAGNNAYGKERSPDGKARPFAHFHDFLRHQVDFYLHCPSSDETTWQLVSGPPPEGEPAESVFYFNDHLFGGPMDFKDAPVPPHMMRYLSQKIAFYSIVHLEEAVRVINRKRAKDDLPEITFEAQAGARLRTQVPTSKHPGGCRVVVCRHGQTDWNKNNKYQGHIDIPMNAVGIEEARGLRLRLNPMHFDRIISSDLQRAMSTATIIAPGRGLLIESNSSIREKAATESVKQFRTRILNELASLARSHPSESLLLSAHGGVIKMLLVNTMGDNTYTINNCSHLVLDFDNKGGCVLVGAQGAWAGGVDTCGQSDWEGKPPT